MSDAGKDNSVPIILQSAGWETLADGRQQLLVHCESMVDYVTMPKKLLFRPAKLFKSGWDSEREVAFYRERGNEDIEAAVRDLM